VQRAREAVLEDLVWKMRLKTVTKISDGRDILTRMPDTIAMASACEQSRAETQVRHRVTQRTVEMERKAFCSGFIRFTHGCLVSGTPALKTTEP
jgi:hypothetical protein